MYQITVKAYDGSIPVQTGSWSPEAGESVRDMEQIPVRVTCTWDRASRTDRFRIRAEALEDLTFPVSVSLERVEEKWTRNEYVFMPAAVYNGNRMESRKIPYPPYCGEKTETGWREVITDIPHLSKDGENRDIQFLSGDMSTPAFGYYSQEDRTGVLLLAKHEENGRYTGFTMREKGEKAVFGISAPGVREGNVYFFGELPDGSGFFPTCNCASDDAGVMLKKSDALELEAECHTFRADSLNHYFKQFDSLRENLEQGKTFYSIPFSKAYETIKDKYMRLNFSDEGYYRVGTTDVVPGYWQAGWGGGGMNTYSFLIEDKGTARQQALSTLSFIVKKLQRENGWYVPMYAKGVCYGDAFMDTGRPALLARKDADLLETYSILMSWKVSRQMYGSRQKSLTTVQRLPRSLASPLIRIR